MNKLFNSLSFKKQIFYGLILVAIIPLIFSSVLITNVYKLALNNRMKAEGDRQAEEITMRLQEFIEGSIKICDILCEDDITAKALIRRTYSEYQQVLYTTLYEESNSFMITPSFGIYDAGGQLYYSNDINVAEDRLPVNWGLLRESHVNSDSYYTISSSEPYIAEGVVLQSAYRVRNSNGILLGYIVMGFTEENLRHIFSDIFPSGDAVLITDSFNNLIYSSDKRFGQPSIDALISGKAPENHRYSWEKEEKSGFYVVIQKEVDDYIGTIEIVKSITIVLSVTSLLLCIVISMKLTKELWQPINQLNEAMNKVRGGDLEVKLITAKTNELGNVINNFNSMTEELRIHMDNKLEKQKELNSIQLRLLQSQLNPHFLYNTLDSIKWGAKINHLDNLAEMIDNLGIILRKSIISDEFISLKKEMEIVESYLEIQRLRTSRWFTYEIELPEVLSSYLVPKLILQPIVENAIIHGIGDMEEGTISIYAEKLGGDLSISVTDNGKGMDKDTLLWFSEGDFKQKEGHFGLYNVNKIIKLHFGNSYGISVSIEEGIGTTISVLLPIKEEDAQ
ncbi:sensor histidine kinase [Alloiococcus sp. CFN-8]|uniref:sensor histidine kinase n=1 Tax=Alloiococcus sp. CFN-8 TaxID=3416081 RepID=UPI003CF4CEEB